MVPHTLSRLGFELNIATLIPYSALLFRSRVWVGVCVCECVRITATIPKDRTLSQRNILQFHVETVHYPEIKYSVALF